MPDKISANAMKTHAIYWKSVVSGQIGTGTKRFEKEDAERALIESYLPAGANEQEVEAAIAEALAETGVTSLKQMGVVMKAAQAKLKGKTVDGKTLSDKVRSRLQ